MTNGMGVWIWDMHRLDSNMRFLLSDDNVMLLPTDYQIGDKHKIRLAHGPDISGRIGAKLNSQWPE
jgi:hypothetical protein